MINLERLEEALSAYLMAGYEPDRFVCNPKDKKAILAYYGRLSGKDTTKILTDFGKFTFQFDDSVKERNVMLVIGSNRSIKLRDLPANLDPYGTVVGI